MRAYTGDRLGDQLDENGRRYLADPLRGARRQDEKIQLAMVFRWFAGDFAPVGAMPSLLGTLLSTAIPSRVLPAARQHLPATLASATAVGFIPWDWSLNAHGS